MKIQRKRIQNEDDPKEDGHYEQAPKSAVSFKI